MHCGETLRLVAGEPVVRKAYHVEPLTPRPTQPAGRAPITVNGSD